MSSINVSEILKKDGQSSGRTKRKRRTSLSNLSDAYSNKSQKIDPVETLDIEPKLEVSEVTASRENKDIAVNTIVNKPSSKVLVSEVEELKMELAKLKGELVSSGIGNTANEKKIVAAIRSESINQNTDEPVISRSMFMKKYKVSSRFIDVSIKSLIGLKIISRAEKDYTKKIKTFCYKLIQ